MKRSQKRTLLFFLLFGLILCMVACKKASDSDTPKPKTPAITSIDPATAPVGSTIAINGTDFSIDSTTTKVTIGGVQATIVSVSPTKIIVVVPAAVVNGPISVTSGGQTTQSATSFTLFVPPLKPIAEKQGTYFKNQTWTSDSIYVLRGMVYIPENYTLTIAPGTIIKGTGPESDPSGTNHAGALIIERRAQLIAKGTATQPIVFTSAKPAGQRQYGDWGGLVLIGRSPINRPRITPYPNGVRGTIEAYGEPFDNSGVLQYVRIEYAGALQPTTPATRLSGLSMFGVGAGTTIDHVQVAYSGSDAFSWFGGSVNLKHLFAFNTFDDDWSSDWGYVGNVQFGLSRRDPEVADQSGSNGFDIETFDASETSDVPPVIPFNGLPQSTPVFTNITNLAFSATPTTASRAKGTGAYMAGIHIKRNSAIAIYNSLFYGYPEGVHLESVTSTSAITGGTIDLKGIVLANVLSPVVGKGVITTDQASTYFTSAGRNNQIIPTSDLASLMLNNFTGNTPNFLLQTGSPLLTGAVTGGKLTNAFFTSVTYRGAFGAENWLANWANLNPQNTEYDR